MRVVASTTFNFKRDNKTKIHMVRKRFGALFVVMFLVLATSFLVTPAWAQGIFDKACPDCGGTGKITKTVDCPDCNGTGKISVSDPSCIGTGKIAHAACGGTGKILKPYQCEICRGSGRTSVIVKKDVHGFEFNALWGFADVKVVAVFRSEYDQGVNANVTAKVESDVTPPLGDIITFTYQESVITYFPPHEDVTVSIVIKDILFEGKARYSMDIASSDGDVHERIINCPICNGTGVTNIAVTDEECGRTGLVDCPDCNGTGKIVMSDSVCHGTGKIDSEVRCATCGGSGYVTDWTKVSILPIIGVGATLGASAFLMKRRKK